MRASNGVGGRRGWEAPPSKRCSRFLLAPIADGRRTAHRVAVARPSLLHSSMMRMMIIMTTTMMIMMMMTRIRDDDDNDDDNDGGDGGDDDDDDDDVGSPPHWTLPTIPVRTQVDP